MIESPCVKICTLDTAKDVCLGCGRTIDEIARWGTMSLVERESIMADLPRRRSKDDSEGLAAATEPTT